MKTRESLAVSAARRQASNGIAKIAALQRNWDGYGADPIDARTIKSARKFLRSLPSVVDKAPSVVPMTRGRLQFEWHRGQKSLEVEFETPDTIHYLQYDPATGVEDEGVLNVAERSKVAAILRWFFAGPRAFQWGVVLKRKFAPGGDSVY